MSKYFKVDRRFNYYHQGYRWGITVYRRRDRQAILDWLDQRLGPRFLADQQQRTWQLNPAYALDDGRPRIYFAQESTIGLLLLCFDW